VTKIVAGVDNDRQVGGGNNLGKTERQLRAADAAA
jgi:hypothetical protein